MAIGPLSAATLTNPSSAAVLGITDANRVQVVGSSVSRRLNITAVTQVKTGEGRVASVSVLVAGSGEGGVNDSATTGGAGITNQLAVIPATVGVYEIDFPFTAGLVITPGTGQTVAVSYV